MIFNKYVSVPFPIDYLNSKSLDYSTYLIVTSYNIVSPVILENDIWSFVGPFDYKIWLLALVSVPIVILCLAITQHPSTGNINWRVSVEFVLRNVLSESFRSYLRVNKKILNKKIYQNILIVIWIWSCFIIIKSYAGKLTAMITRPNIDLKFTKLQDFLDQDEVSTVVGDTIQVIEYMKKSKSPMMGQILNKTIRLDVSSETEWASNCFTKNTQYTGKHASICDSGSISLLLSSDFGESGKCNWYTMKEGFYYATAAMAFQVCRKC